MKNIYYLNLFAVILLIVIGISCKENKNLTFNDSEIELIKRYKNSIMPLKTINNNSDSLFLRKTATPLSFNDIKSEYFTYLTNSMLKTVTNPENEGVGIAAPQIGISKKLIAVQRFDKINEPFEFYANPKIITFYGDKQIGSEGCLSVPDMRGEVKRYKKIVIEYNSIKDFKIKSDTIEDFTAVIFQHEIDHLNGILYIDRADTITNK